MKTKTRLILLSSLFLLTAGAIVLLPRLGADLQSRKNAVVETPKTAPSSTVGEKPGLPSFISDKPIAAFQSDLLDLAFKTASALPTEPHIKTRSRLQEEVVDACLELDQVGRALTCIVKIDNWRRGACYADIAFYLAKHGLSAHVQTYLDTAIQIAELPEDSENIEGWRRDRIRAKIARVYVLLGQSEKAVEFEKGLVDAEASKTHEVRATLSDEKVFEEQLSLLDKVVALGNFDLIQGSLNACAQLFNRAYDDRERRTLVEEKIKSSWKRVPVTIRIELLMKLARFALDHKDQAKALELVKETQATLEATRWAPEDRIPVMARLAALRHAANDEAQGKIEVDKALAFFEEQRDQIVNIYRGRALRPIAEAYQSMGDSSAALAVYIRAFEEGIENPNSRPRAEDLSSTCLSMATHGVKPDANLWERISQIYAGLGEPW